MKRLPVAFAVASLLVPLVACMPSDVEASDYDQTCAKDDDCIAVNQLDADGTDCSTECNWGAINKNDKAKYDEDFADSVSNCGSRRSPFCEEARVPACVQGKCQMK